MNLWLTIRVALRALAANRLRSSLTMLGIIIGVGAVITMIAVGTGAQARVEDQINSLGSNLIIIVSGSVTSGGARMGSGTSLTISEDDAQVVMREIPEVIAAPALRGGVQIVAGNTNWSTGMFGVTPEYPEVRQWSIVSGRGFDAGDMSGAAKVAVLGQTVANSLFGDTDPLDQVIRIRKVPFRVIGVLERKGQSLFGQDQDDVILVPLTSARKRVLGGLHAKQRAVNTIWVKVRQGYDMKAAEDQIRDVLRQRHRLQQGQGDDFYLRNLSEVLQAREASSRILTLLLAAVASVSLVVGGIGIMNIMLVSVTERTREIGLRMAVGARGRDILTQFLVEAVTLSLVGGIVGILLGAGGSLAIGHFAEWRTELTASSIVLATGFAAVVGVFFGYYPARQAARLSPIEALRYE
ncbi:MAG: multidrug ABC transporter substrate-binding protein [Betaproteobacteria bacterium RIFCSPLOWO2_12_FULL_63_13]|nr:MAG: multidrug ABC transporter substrate-binding protein [Betaproteobacteria bacterium RIFCSPLOWO2_02_FULL_63_19]OGA54396.1 MAG: multidrug ABC transporter substrate-binding protein [Betaproteobacteria bacterium RIFCSPLOWO2_12_FULL_63_13]